MNKMLRILAVVSVLMLVLAGAGLAEEPKAGEQKAEAKVEDKLAFTMDGIDGKSESASKLLRGKANVLIFAQSACASCREELINMSIEAKKITDKATISVVMMDMSGSNDSLTKYLADLGVKFPAYKDPKYQIAPKFGVTVTPATAVLDSKGELVKLFRGNSPDLPDQIADLLKGVK